MKIIPLIVSIILLSLLISLYRMSLRVDLSTIIKNGNEEIMEYCTEYNLLPTFGLIGIEKGRGTYILEYFIYTNMNKIHAIDLLIDRRPLYSTIRRTIPSTATPPVILSHCCWRVVRSIWK